MFAPINSLSLSFMNKYDSRSLKCLFLSTSPIASSHACWGVYNCLWYDKFASVLFFLYVLCLVGFAAEINKTVKLSGGKSTRCSFKKTLSSTHFCPAMCKVVFIVWRPFSSFLAWNTAFRLHFHSSPLRFLRFHHYEVLLRGVGN